MKGSGTRKCPFCDEEIRVNAIKCKHCGSILSGDSDSGIGFANPDRLVQEALADLYEISGIVGKGGMAVVYKAEQKSLGRPIALKVVHQNLVHDEEFIQRFVREARVSASLNHHNIVTVHDVGVRGPVHYIAMEFLQGITLSDYLRRNTRLSAGQTIQFILPIALALDYIHQRGLIHRDIKTSNIILTENETRPVLTDFGIVHVSGEAGLSQVGAILGTPEYMSPEQAEGLVELDHRTDVYSLGLIMYECLTGHVPFHTDNPLGTIHQVIHESPPPAPLRVRSIPAWLGDLVLACLEKDRGRRVQSAGELAAFLSDKHYRAPVVQNPDARQKQTLKISAEEILRFSAASVQNSQAVSLIMKIAAWGKANTELLLRWAIVMVMLVMLTVAGVVFRQSKDQESQRVGDILTKGDISFREKNFEEAIAMYQIGLSLRNDPVFRERIQAARDSLAQQGLRAQPVPGGLIADEPSAPAVAEDPVRSAPQIQPADTPQQPAHGTLTVRVVQGGSIFIDGRRVGSGTYTGQLPPGTYQIETRQPGYRPEVRSVQLRSGADLVASIEMEPLEAEPPPVNMRRPVTDALSQYGISLVLITGNGTIGDFYLSTYEVTQSTWESVMGSNPSIFKGRQRPVENVSVDEVARFLNRLSGLVGHTCRLPTESEWEYAAGGGRNSANTTYSGSNIIDEVAWYESNTSETKNVGGKRPNALGLYDMCGNVWELCANGYLRGGSWLSPINNCRISSRKAASGGRDHTVGFRICISAN